MLVEFIVGMIVLGALFMIFRDKTPETVNTDTNWQTPINAEPKVPTSTNWKPCTYCPDCKEAYSQAGMRMSIYTCPGCGKDTLVGHSFRYKDDKLEVQSRSR